MHERGVRGMMSRRRGGIEAADINGR